MWQGMANCYRNVALPLELSRQPEENSRVQCNYTRMKLTDRLIWISLGSEAQEGELTARNTALL